MGSIGPSTEGFMRRAASGPGNPFCIICMAISGGAGTNGPYGLRSKQPKYPTLVDSLDALTEILAAFLTYPAPGTGISSSEDLGRSEASEPRPPAPCICSSGLRLIISCKRESKIISKRCYIVKPAC